MSTDYYSCCFTCRRAIHLGQRFTVGWSFGYGKDDAPGHRSAGAWLLEHLEAYPPHDVRVLQEAPDGFAFDEYTEDGGFRPDPDND